MITRLRVASNRPTQLADHLAPAKALATNLELSPHMKSPRLCRGIITGAIQYCCFASTTRAMTVQRLMFGRSYGDSRAYACHEHGEGK